MANQWKRRQSQSKTGTRKSRHQTEDVNDIIERLIKEEIDRNALAPEMGIGHSVVAPVPSGLTVSECQRLGALLVERCLRKREALRIYEPLPYQDSFHASHAPERSLRASNRAGKTLAAAIEFGRAVTGQDPYNKYPKVGRAIIVCKTEKQCGEVVFKKLFKSGAYRIIRDETTGNWRTFHPERDKNRRKESRPAPPIIPRRFYDPRQIVWNKKMGEIPEKIILKNGWEINFFSSLGEAPMGWDVDIVWFDEEIIHPSWYNEMAARLIDRTEYDEARGVFVGGKFFWSATPEAGTIKLFEIHAKAVECSLDDWPRVTEHTATLYDNPYLTEGAKKIFIDKLEGNEDVMRVKVLGEFALLGLRIYHEFAPRGVHGCDSFEIPDDWTRYIAIDPGRQVCAVLFCAVPPPHVSKYTYIYDELYIRRCNARVFAETLRNRIGRQVIWEALFDHRAGRVTEMGSGRTVEEQYLEELKGLGVKFAKHNSCSFTYGCDDPEARILAVKSGLHIRDGKSSKWMVFKDKLPWFIKESEEYRNAVDAKTGLPLDKPLKIKDHLMDCWGYLAVHDLRYRRPRPRNNNDDYASAYLKEKRERKMSRSESGKGVKVW